MDNRINSGVSFQAKLVTNIKGRNNIMERVAPEFEKLTKKIPGEFEIKRIRWDKASRHLAEMNYNNGWSVTPELFELISQETANPKEIAKNLTNLLKVIMIEISFNKKIEPIVKSLEDRCEDLKRAEYKLARAKRFGLNEVVEIVSKTVNDYKADIAKLKAKISDMAASAAKKMEKYEANGLGVADEKDFFLSNNSY